MFALCPSPKCPVNLFVNICEDLFTDGMAMVVGPSWTSGSIRAETYGFDLDFAIKKLDSVKLFLTLIDLLAFFTCFLAISTPAFQLCIEAKKLPFLYSLSSHKDLFRSQLLNKVS